MSETVVTPAEIRQAVAMGKQARQREIIDALHAELADKRRYMDPVAVLGFMHAIDLVKALAVEGEPKP